MKTVFVCEDKFDSILCGVYDAWMSRLGHANVKLELDTGGNLELFCEYQNVEVTQEKLEKVITAIQTKISLEVYEYVYKASLSKDEERADKIYRYLIYGFHYGAKIVDMIQLSAVYDMEQMLLHIKGEAHLLRGFVRFSQMKEGVLLSRIKPKNDILTLLAPHFADRLSGENWMIYDENRQKAAIHPQNGAWFILQMDAKEWKAKLSDGTDETEYQELWRIFHRSIAIKERTNPNCQRGHLALRYRPYMTEFQESSSPNSPVKSCHDEKIMIE